MSSHATGAGADDIPIFRDFPRLRHRLPHISLATLPTPLEPADDAARVLGIGKLLVKRDDLSSALFGGNKVRKLEFLLAEARSKRARTVMTFGTAGSNHAAATAIHARRLGIGTISMLRNQANADYVRSNLLLSLRAGAELHAYRTRGMLWLSARLIGARAALRTGAGVHVITSGGSSTLGTVGLVNAGLELRDQLLAQRLPEPDLLYVPVGTGGSAAGLQLGLRAAGLKTRVIGVRVVPPDIDFGQRCQEVAQAACDLLRSADPDFPAVDLSAGDFAIRGDFFGPGYAVFSPEGQDAVRFAEKHIGLKLEGTYTGKSFAALIADARGGLLGDKTVVFWDSCDARDFSAEIANIDPRGLPHAFRRYFDQPLQERAR